MLSPLFTLSSHTDYVYVVRQLQDGRVLSCSDDRKVNVWELGAEEGPQLAETLPCHAGVFGLVELADGRLLSGDKTGCLKIWG